MQELPEAMLAQECGWDEPCWSEWLRDSSSEGAAEDSPTRLSVPEGPRRKLFVWLSQQAKRLLGTQNGSNIDIGGDRLKQLGFENRHSGLADGDSALLNGEETDVDMEAVLPADAPPDTAAAQPMDTTEGRSQVEAETGEAPSALPRLELQPKEAAAAAPFSAVSVEGLTGSTAEEASKVKSWTAWQAALGSHSAPAPGSAAEDEHMHPYTKLMLRQPPTQYVLRPDQDARQIAGMSGLATPSGMTPSASAEDGSAFHAHPSAADAGADSGMTPRQAGAFTPTLSQLGVGSRVVNAQAAEGPGGTQAAGTPQQMLSQPDDAAAAAAQGPPEREEAAALKERLESGSQAGPATPASEGGAAMHALGGSQPSRGLVRQRSQVNYSAMAGNSTRKANTEQAKTGRKHAGKHSERSEQRHRGQTALAVQNAVAAGVA